MVSQHLDLSIKLDLYSGPRATVPHRHDQTHFTPLSSAEHRARFGGVYIAIISILAVTRYLVL